MDRIMRQSDIISEVAKRTGFFKNNIAKIFDALEEVVIENMQQAKADEKSELHMFKGITIGGRFSEEHEVKDPRNQEVLITPSKFIPYVKFTQSFRNKINK